MFVYRPAGVDTKIKADFASYITLVCLHYLLYYYYYYLKPALRESKMVKCCCGSALALMRIVITSQVP